jgi:hypothetical protein
VLYVGGCWVIADWGLGQIPPSRQRRLTVQGQTFGTPDFTAPEVFVDPRRATVAADVYSLGRIAAWGTGIQRSEHRESSGTRGGAWRELVDGTTAIDPRKRWSLSRALSYLDRVTFAQRALDRESGDPCPHCLADIGYDSCGRCLRCHMSNPSYA